MAAWQRLSQALGEEPALVRVPAERLRARWEAGLSAVLLHGGDIVVHTSAARVLDDTLFEMSTAWTHPAWRGRGLLSELRASLVDRLSGRSRVLVSVTLGVGLGPHLIRQGWSCVGWDELPFFGAAIGQHCPAPLPGVLLAPLPAHLPPLRGAPTPALDPTAWSQLWVSSRSLASALDQHLAQRWRHDLPAWQRHVLLTWVDRGPSGAALRGLPPRPASEAGAVPVAPEVVLQPR